jgi:hypothetical protein
MIVKMYGRERKIKHPIVKSSGSKQAFTIGFQNMLTKYLSKSIIKSVFTKMDFRNTKPRLYIPVGGAVINGMNEALLQSTQRNRTYKLVSVQRDGRNRKDLAVFNHMNYIREKLKGLEEKDKDEYVQFQLLEGNKVKSYPHLDTVNDKKYLHDTVYLIGCKDIRRDGNEKNWIFSVQSLHALGGIGPSLLNYPLETLGECKSEKFRDYATSIMSKETNKGFESIIKVKCEKEKINGISPRMFYPIPTISDLELSVVEYPRALK